MAFCCWHEVYYTDQVQRDSLAQLLVGPVLSQVTEGFLVDNITFLTLRPSSV